MLTHRSLAFHACHEVLCQAFQLYRLPCMMHLYSIPPADTHLFLFNPPPPHLVVGSSSNLTVRSELLQIIFLLRGAMAPS